MVQQGRLWFDAFDRDLCGGAPQGNNVGPPWFLYLSGCDASGLIATEIDSLRPFATRYDCDRENQEITWWWDDVVTAHGTVTLWYAIKWDWLATTARYHQGVTGAVDQDVVWYYTYEGMDPYSRLNDPVDDYDKSETTDSTLWDWESLPHLHHPRVRQLYYPQNLPVPLCYRPRPDGIRPMDPP